MPSSSPPIHPAAECLASPIPGGGVLTERLFVGSSVLLVTFFVLLAFLTASPLGYPAWAGYAFGGLALGWCLVLVAQVGWSFAPRFRSGRLTSVLVTSVMILVTTVSLAWMAWYDRKPEPVIGNDDQGTYALTAIALTRSGHDRIPMPALGLATAEEWPLLTTLERPEGLRGGSDAGRVPMVALGFRAVDDGAAKAVFPPAYPVLLASGMLLGGTHGLSVAQLLLVPVSALLLGLFLARTVHPWAGFLGWVGTLACPLHVWMGNAIYAEQLIQVWSLLSLCLMTWHVPGHRSPWVMLAAIAAAVAAMTVKVDGLLIGACLMVGAAALSVRHGQRGLLWTAMVGGVAATSWYWWESGGAYLLGTARAVLSGWSILVVLLAVAVGWGVYRWKGIMTPRRLRVGRFLLVGVLGALALYAYVWRPGPATPDSFWYWPQQRDILSHREETFLRLGWYLTPIGLLLSVVGVLTLWGLTINRLLLLLLTIGTALLVVFCYDLFNNPLQPYAMRRFLTLGIPVLVAGIACWWLALSTWARVPRRVAAGIGGLMLAFLVLSWVPLGAKLVQVGRYSGFTAQLEQMASLVPPRSLILTSRRGQYVDIMMPLRVIGGHDVVFHQEPLNDHDRQTWASLLRRCQGAGFQLVYLDFGTRPITVAPNATITGTVRGDLIYDVMPYHPERLDLTPIRQRRRSYTLRLFSVP